MRIVLGSEFGVRSGVLIVTLLIASFIGCPAMAQEKKADIVTDEKAIADRDAALAKQEADMEALLARAHNGNLSDEERATLIEALTRLHGQGHGEPYKRPEPVVAVTASVGIKKTETAEAAHTFDIVVMTKDAEEKEVEKTVSVVVADKEAQQAVDTALAAVYNGDYVPRERLAAAQQQAADATAWGAGLAKKTAGKDKTLSRQRTEIIALNKQLSDTTRRLAALREQARAPRRSTR